MIRFKSFITESVSFRGRVYHGTDGNFSKFEQKKSRILNDNFGGGVAYFTDVLPVAMTYAKSMAKKSGGDARIYTAAITIKKLFDVDKMYTGNELIDLLPVDIESFARGARLLSINSDKFKIISQLKSGTISLTGDQVFRGLSNGMKNTAKARSILISKKYDGLRYNGDMGLNIGPKHSVYLVYDTKNIRIEKSDVLTASIE